MPNNSPNRNKTPIARHNQLINFTKLQSKFNTLQSKKKKYKQVTTVMKKLTNARYNPTINNIVRYVNNGKTYNEIENIYRKESIKQWQSAAINVIQKMPPEDLNNFFKAAYNSRKTQKITL